MEVFCGRGAQTDVSKEDLLRYNNWLLAQSHTTHGLLTMAQGSTQYAASCVRKNFKW